MLQSKEKKQPQKLRDLPRYNERARRKDAKKRLSRSVIQLLNDYYKAFDELDALYSYLAERQFFPDFENYKRTFQPTPLELF